MGHVMPVRNRAARRSECRRWTNDDTRASWLDQRRQTRPGDARPGRRICPRNHSSPGPRPGILDGHGISGGGGCDATPEALLLPGCQPLRALFTPTVSTKTHKTGDLAVATREKRTSKIIGAAAPARDHGGSIVGAWRTKSETAPTAPPFMILKPCPSLSRTKLQDHGRTAGGTATTP